MQKLVAYLKPYAGVLVLTIALLFAQAFCSLLLPNYMSDIVDNGVLRGDMAHLLSTGIKMAIITLAGSVASIFVCLMSAHIASSITRDLRRDLFTKIECFSNYEFDRFSTASLITRCTNDVMQIQALLLMGIRFIWLAPVMAIGGLIMAEGHSNGMGWIIALPVTVLIGVIVLVLSVTMPKFYSLQSLMDKLNLISRENLTGMMVIRAFNERAREEKRFDESNTRLTDTVLFANRMMAILPGALTFIMNGTALLIVWVCAKQIAESNVQAGDMIAFIQYAMTIIMAFVMLSIIFIMIPRAQVSANRIVEVLNVPLKIIDSPQADDVFDASKKGVVEFKNVSFRYPNAERDMLSDISFTLSPGKTTAVIGPTGSGKSTIAYLALRLYETSGGAIYVDGKDIRSITQYSLRRKIAYVPQNTKLFSGTIKSNINYGKEDISFEETKMAADAAQALEFIMEKPETFDAPIAQGGGNVSGGQKQRIAIARALAKGAEVLIFDDSFSALDFKTDAAVRKKLKEAHSSAAALVIAQRISSIMNADEILVLENGKIIGRGVHAELMKNCPEYSEIAKTQLAVVAE
ncbi:MAG: ABC transporter ATP-binding protein/permease [Spirochaetaceae bacterium]|jgi:ATP-binding cassette subfamily B protein|nr:ABC transporter ATP-binding protein/permease [Spirochaetaceae bacterium]